MHKPKIIICRHAESLEDVDKEIYDHISDLEIPLTLNGVRQAGELATILPHLLTKNNVRFYTSRGIRNQQTLEITLPKLPEVIKVQVEIEPLIVKQDWGMITSLNRPHIEAERYKTGVLRYTFPTGESTSSLIERLTAFKEKAFRIQHDEDCDIVVFSHGFEFRVLLMIIMGWSEETFESFGNLTNCEYRILTKGANGTYELDRPLTKHGQQVTRLMTS